MLTDIAIKSLKPKEKIYKVADRDGLYVAVTPAGSKIFRYDYRVNGRRETLTIGRYGRYGISLAVARERLIDAKKKVDEGISPAKEKVSHDLHHFGFTDACWSQKEKATDGAFAVKAGKPAPDGIANCFDHMGMPDEIGRDDFFGPVKAVSIGFC